QRDPEDRELQDAHPTDAIGEDACAPAADGHANQRGRAEIACLRLGHAEGRDQRRNDQRVDRRIHRVEAEACEAGPIGAPLDRVELGIPAETHQTVSIRCERTGADWSALLSRAERDFTADVNTCISILQAADHGPRAAAPPDDVDVLMATWGWLN